MSSRWIVLLLAAAAGGILYVAYSILRARWGAKLDRLDVDELGLELMAGCCAFVVFTTPACQPCKAALRVVRDAAEKATGPTEVTTVDALEREDLTLAYDVRTIPTVFLITASGHVVTRWRGVPAPEEARGALAAM